MNDKPQATPPTPTPSKPGAGSLALGIALAWLINVGGALLLLAMAPIATSALSLGGLLLLNAAPLVASFAVAIWMLVKGSTRTGIGIFIGVASIFAVAILLAAACFGLVFSGAIG